MTGKPVKLFTVCTAAEPRRYWTPQGTWDSWFGRGVVLSESHAKRFELPPGAELLPLTLGNIEGAFAYSEVTVPTPAAATGAPAPKANRHARRHAAAKRRQQKGPRR